MMQHGLPHAYKRCKPEPCGECVEARRAYMREYREKNAERLKANEKAYYQANKHWRNKKSPEAQRRGNLWSWYRLRPEDFDALLEQQGGLCAICKSENHSARNWHVDHDHRCCPGNRSCGGCVRGLLCGPCNVGLGMFKDSPRRLAAAIEYLATS